MQHLPWQNLALTASATLVTGLNYQIKTGFTAQVINILYLPNYQTAKVSLFSKISNSDIDEQLAQQLWNNTRYPMSDKFKLGFWVIAAMEGIDSDTSMMLRDHFLIDYPTMDSVLK